MPAIKFNDESTIAIATGAHGSDTLVMIKTKGGGVFRAPLIGFWYSGSENLQGQTVKLIASEVTNESGNRYSFWRPVGSDEVVLGKAVQMGEEWFVYGLVDRQSWPVVVKAGSSSQEARES